MNIKTKIEPLKYIEDGNINYKIIKLAELSESDREVLNPAVPPTSGIRMQIYEKEDNIFYMPLRYQYLFFRVFKSLSQTIKEELNKDNPNLLLVSDHRPSSSYLLEHCAKIFTFDGYNIYFQEVYDEKSKKKQKMIHIIQK